MAPPDSITEEARRRLEETATVLRAHLGPEDAERAWRVSDLLAAAALNLSSADVGHSLSAALALDRAAALGELLGAEFDALDHASLSLGIEDTASALDLCAAAGAVATKRAVPRGERLPDLEGWRPEAAALVAWRDVTRQDRTYKLLLAWRHHLVHRDPERVPMRMGPTAPKHAGLAPEYRYPSAWRVRVHPEQPAFEFHPPRDLADIIRFGAETVVAFCDALLAALDAA